MGFGVRQLVDALSPANFLATNPEAHAARARDGRREPDRRHEPVLGGPGQGPRLDVPTKRPSRSAATSPPRPGAVVFENELMQLIQYTPTHGEVHKRPLRDRAAVHQQVLHPRPAARKLVGGLRGRRRAIRCSCVSWRNIDAEHGPTRWDDYLEQGVMQAIDVALRRHACATGSTRWASASAAPCWPARWP